MNHHTNVIKSLVYAPLEIVVEYPEVNDKYPPHRIINKPDIFINGFHEVDFRVALDEVLMQLDKKDKRIEELEETLKYLKRLVGNL